MSELDSLYREVILDHYKNPRGHGVIDGADAEAEGQNPLCGDEVSIAVAFEGDTIADVKFQGRGCAISQAATSMLMDMVRGRSAQEVASMSRDELLDEVGHPPDARAPQVRASRPGRPQARPPQGPWHPAPAGVGRARGARALVA